MIDWVKVNNSVQKSKVTFDKNYYKTKLTLIKGGMIKVKRISLFIIEDETSIVVNSCGCISALIKGSIKSFRLF